MSGRMVLSRLPEGVAKALLISGEYPQLLQALEEQNIPCIATQREPRLPKPIGWHPDMQAGILGGQIFVLKGSPLKERLESYHLSVRETAEVPGQAYPKDALCNVLSWGHQVAGNPKTADQNILQEAQRSKMNWIPVKQGYTACSTALVDDNSAITADQGVATALIREGMEVLCIEGGYIRLPSYSTGFFGGCCGKLAPDRMIFTGQIDNHPQGEEIRRFLYQRGVSVMELTRGPLLDVGGILPLL